MGERYSCEESPPIVIISPVEDDNLNPEDEKDTNDNIMEGILLVKSDPEVSGRLSVLSGESAGSRSLMIRVREADI